MSKKKYEIYPDEIFMDSQNLPEFDETQFEGRLERPLSKNIFTSLRLIFLLVAVIFVSRSFNLSVVNGRAYAERSKNNSLHHEVIIAPRGIIYDRNGEKLAWNDVAEGESDDYPTRQYITAPGFAQFLGVLKYPAKDSSGFYYRDIYEPEGGAELYLDEIIAGKNGLKITETDVAGKMVSGSLLEKPVEGGNAITSIDAGIQSQMFTVISNTAKNVDFRGGAGVMIDVRSGEIIAMTSYPEYDLNIFNKGDDKEAIQSYLNDPDNPFLNRAVTGLYTPGSIVKPFLAFGALEEGVITPEKEILSTGKLVLPNPYFTDQPSIFRDWKAHGYTDMRKAIAVSSDVYFYQIGGGFEGQKGLGITRIDKYLKLFGFGEPTGIGIFNEPAGLIPTPEWKKATFDEDWRLGDTYNTSIGQYGMQVTPLQAARAIAAIANGGYLVTPTLLKEATTTEPDGERIEFSSKDKEEAEHFKIVQEGMRLSVTEGTAIGMSNPNVKVAGKTGTAELGALKHFVNSWTVGYFPYENPKYAYAIVMEKGPVKNLVGATSVMRQVIDWIAVNKPEYIK
jgi:penicillin-binding protein 2